MNIKGHTTGELEQLAREIATELDFRKEEVVYEIGHQKATYPPTRKQLDYAEYVGVKIECSLSQVMKRMESKDMSEAIDFAKGGKRVVIRL